MNDSPAPFSISIPVRFSDVDMYRVAWHGRYVAWLEEARNRMVALAGFSIVDFLDRDYLFPIVEISIRYRRPARFGDTLRITPRYLPEPIARLSFEYEIHNEASGDLLATATTRQVILRGDELIVTKSAEIAGVLASLEAIQNPPPPKP